MGVAINGGTIDESSHFIAIITGNYLRNGRCLAQLERAQDLKKPILLVMEKDVDAPEWMLRGAEIVKFDTQLSDDDMEKISNWIDRTPCGGER